MSQQSYRACTAIRKRMCIAGPLPHLPPELWWRIGDSLSCVDISPCVNGDAEWTARLLSTGRRVEYARHWSIQKECIGLLRKSRSSGRFWHSYGFMDLFAALGFPVFPSKGELWWCEYRLMAMMGRASLRCLGGDRIEELIVLLNSRESCKEYAHALTCLVERLQLDLY